MNDQLVAETSTLQHTTLTTDKRPYLRWDSNSQSQQASGGRPKPYNARPPEPVLYLTILHNNRLLRKDETKSRKKTACSLLGSS